MIEQTFQYGVGAGAAPTNIMPASFNPIPADGSLEIFAVADPTNFGAGDTLPTLSVTLGGPTPIQPIQPTSVGINEFGQIGVSPNDRNVIMPRQGVAQGTNSQLIVTGGTHAMNLNIKVRFRSLQEIAQGIGQAA